MEEGMTIDESTAQAVLDTESYRSHCGWLTGVWLLATGVVIASTALLYSRIPPQPNIEVAIGLSVLLLIGFGVYKSFFYRHEYRIKNKLLQQYKSGRERLAKTVLDGTARTLASVIEGLKVEKNSLLDSLVGAQEQSLRRLVESRHREELQRHYEEKLQLFKQQYQVKATEIRNRHHLYQAYFALESAETYLKQRRAELDAQWKQAYEGFSWANKLWYGDSPDFRELDKKLSDLSISKRLLLREHGDDFEKLNQYYSDQSRQALERVTHARANIEAFIRQSKYEDAVGNDVLKKGFWFAAMSVPVSMWADASRAGDVYDVLRSVNSNYAGMSDSEIWWETLFLQSESLAGLVSLTKGAYLESLVASNTGGQLFEHFNHPDTDIIIDGVAFQIKATDSADYIHSVADGIPVIATSEVADVTDAIDSGYTNEELQEAVSLAVGGTVFDAGDTAIDAILTGVGGLGVFATLSGINHATKMYENGGDPVEAMFEGAGVAIGGTARAAVNTLEFGYKVLNSRPSRFVGRMLQKGLIKIDDKLMGEDSGVKKR